MLNNGDPSVFYEDSRYRVYVRVMEERGISNIVSIWMQFDHFLVCIEEIVLDGPRNASRELAQWDCVSPSEEQAEPLSAPFMPVSNKATS